jgi:hypothetical protein
MFLRYAYSLKNQMADKKTVFGELPLKAKTAITNAVEQQIKWLDSNPTAKVDELRTHKQQLVQVVIRTMTEFNGQSADSNDTRGHSNHYEGDM